MAIAYVTANGVQSNTGTSHSFSLTVSGSDTHLLVFAMTNGTLSSVTFNGISCTFLSSTSGSQNIHTYRQTAPSAGTFNCVCTTSASTFCYPTGIVHSGVDQTNPINTSNTANASGAISVTTSVADCWAVLGIRDDNDGITTAGTNCTSRYSSDTQAYDSNGTTITSGVAFSMTANNAAATSTQSIVALAPSTAVTRRLLLLGVGQ